MAALNVFAFDGEKDIEKCSSFTFLFDMLLILLNYFCLSTDKNSVKNCGSFTFFCRKIQNKVYIQIGVNYGFLNTYLSCLKANSLQCFNSIVFECEKTKEGFLECNFIKIFSKKENLNLRDRYNVAVIMGGFLSKNKLKNALSDVNYMETKLKFQNITNSRLE